jgi:hypothetical protein
MNTAAASTLPVASTIAAQIGNLAFRMMGASNLAGSAHSLTFAIKGSKNANRIQVTLDASDTYTVAFFKVRGHSIRLVASVEGVYRPLPQPLKVNPMNYENEADEREESQSSKLSSLEVRLITLALVKHAGKLEEIAESTQHRERAKELRGEATASRKLAERLTCLASGSSLEVCP